MGFEKLKEWRPVYWWEREITSKNQYEDVTFLIFENIFNCLGKQVYRKGEVTKYYLDPRAGDKW